MSKKLPTPTTSEEAANQAYKIVLKLAHKWKRNHFEDFDDIFQEGMIGVTKAYRDFEPERGYRFTTLAYRYANQAMSDFCRKEWKKKDQVADFVQVEDVDEFVESNIDDLIDLDQRIQKQDELTKAICYSRLQGYTFAQIAEGLTKLGQPHTLHQVRNKYQAALGE